MTGVRSPTRVRAPNFGELPSLLTGYYRLSTRLPGPGYALGGVYGQLSSEAAPCVNREALTGALGADTCRRGRRQHPDLLAYLGGSLAPLRASFPWRVAPADKTIKALHAADNPVLSEVLPMPPAARGRCSLEF
jgi:hypothetical protein